MRLLAVQLVSAAIASAMLLGSGVAQTADDADIGRIFPQPGRVDAGRAVVAGAYGLPQVPGSQANNCFRCHGFDGQAQEAAGFPRLADQVYKYLYDSLRDYASGARNNPVMTPIAKSLSDQQMRDAAAYYSAQIGTPHTNPPEVDPELLQLGGALAAVGSAERGVQACANCHGPEGVGLPPTYPYLAGQIAPYLEEQLRAWKTGTRRSEGNGGVIMELIARRLSDEEIRAVSLYYASIRPPSVTPEQAGQTSAFTAPADLKPAVTP